MVPAFALPSTVQRWLSRGVWVGLAALVSLGPGAGEPPYDHFGAAIIAIPLVLRYVCGIDLRPTHLTWLTVALALHPLGAMYELYLDLWWYDHLSHAASATLVAAVPYVVIRADFRRRGERFRVTPTVAAAVILWVLAAGSVWEAYELVEPNLLVFGVEDTVKDMGFNVVGSLAVLYTGRWFLADPGDEVAARAGSVADAGRSVASAGRSVAGRVIPTPSRDRSTDPDPALAD